MRFLRRCVLKQSQDLWCPQGVLLLTDGLNGAIANLVHSESPTGNVEE